MRRVRMLGLGLLAMLVMGVVAAAPAMANEYTGPWKTFKDCPINNPAFRQAVEEKPHEGVTYCFVGRTSGGKQGGHFTVGKVTTPLNWPITLQGGVVYNEFEEEGGRHYLAGKVYAAEGGETLESPELEVPHGLRLITKAIQEEEGWPKALRKEFAQAERAGYSHLRVKIEVAGGNELYEDPKALSSENLLEEQGPGFILPLKVRLINPFLERLDQGKPCTVGSDADPVIQELTTGASGAFHGKFGQLHFAEEFSILEDANDTLVDGTYTVPAVEGCGGPAESYIDAALNHILELPGAAEKSSTELTGTLYLGAGIEAIENYETGKTF